MDKQTILGRLDIKAFYSAELPSFKSNNSGLGQALCPFHDDTKPSLSVDLKAGGFRCFGCNAKGSIFDFYAKRNGVGFGEAFNALAKEAGLTDSEPQRRIAKTYDYKDESGNLLFQVVRYEPKGFSQRRPDGKGDWIWNLKGIRFVPFNLPDVTKADSVILCEGEKDCLTLKGMGLAASCNPMGAGKWRAEYNQYFKGKQIVILPDNDEPGKNHAATIARNLHGVARSVKIVELQGLPVKGDATDWVKAGGTKESLLKITREVKEWRHPTREFPGIVRLETVEPEKVEWLWSGYIPLGKVTLLDGDPGNGKSLFTVDLIARCTNHGIMPDGSKGITGGAVMLALEDGLADTVVPRLEIAGGNKKKVVSLQGVPDVSGELRFPTIEDVAYISKACKEVDAKLVVIDPLMGYMGRVNSWKDQEIRRGMAPLVRMAEEENIAVLVVRHLNKSDTAKSLYRGGGSIGITGLARVSLLIAKDPEEGNRRILAGIKSNLAPLPDSLSYVIENCEGIPRISWGGISSHTADTLLSVPVSPEEKTAVDEAKDFLQDILADGALEANDVVRQSKRAGISEKTLSRAKKLLGVKSKKSQFGGGWKWTLPDEDGQEMPKVVNKYNDHLGGNLTILGDKEVIDLAGEEVEIVQ